MIDIEFRVTAYPGPTDGGDTFISQYPAEGRAVELSKLRQWALHTALEMASLVDSRLGYVDIYITGNPGTVKEKGIFPEHEGCADCIAGVELALDYLEHNPGHRMVVGVMHWLA